MSDHSPTDPFAPSPRDPAQEHAAAPPEGWDLDAFFPDDPDSAGYISFTANMIGRGRGGGSGPLDESGPQDASGRPDESNQPDESGPLDESGPPPAPPASGRGDIGNDRSPCADGMGDRGDDRSPPAGGSGDFGDDREASPDSVYARVATRATARQASSAVAFVSPEPQPEDPLLGFAPYVHTAPRRNSITPELQRRFVATLAATGVVMVAARKIGRSTEALYKLRHRPGAEGFAAAWDAAIERGTARLEEIALERALVGTRTPIVSRGEILGHWDKPDNTLLRFLLRHRLPQRYGWQDIGPGHPTYDRIRKQVEEDALRDMPSEAEVLDALNAKLDLMRANEEAFAQMLEEERREILEAAGEAAAEATRATGVRGDRDRAWVAEYRRTHGPGGDGPA